MAALVRASDAERSEFGGAPLRAVEEPARQLDLDERSAVARLLVVLRRPADGASTITSGCCSRPQDAEQKPLPEKGKASYSSVMTRRRIVAMFPSRRCARHARPLPGTEGLGSQCSYAAATSAAYELVLLQAGGDGGLETVHCSTDASTGAHTAVAGSCAASLA